MLQDVDIRVAEPEVPVVPRPQCEEASYFAKGHRLVEWHYSWAGPNMNEVYLLVEDTSGGRQLLAEDTHTLSLIPQFSREEDGKRWCTVYQAREWVDATAKQQPEPVMVKLSEVIDYPVVVDCRGQLMSFPSEYAFSYIGEVNMAAPEGRFIVPRKVRIELEI
jgi:hypothetical protein